jgi:predicted dehydrogenase
VVRAAERADRLLASDFCYRHVQGLPELRRRIASGELGRIEAIDLTFHNAYAPNGPWCFDRAQAGGGCLLDLGIHLLDLVQWLLGGTLHLVSAARYAQGRRLGAADSAVEDLAFCEYRHASGTLVRLVCSWHANLGCAARIGADIHGSRAGARWRNIDDSFMDFVVEVCRGTQCERLGGYPDDWTARALLQWLQQLSNDRGFDPQIWELCAVARLIEEAYQQ